MPSITFDIAKSSIEEDQVRVATQWTKTFIYNNPPDVATNMAQLVMACVGRGDFKIRDFMSQTSELHAPSQHLSIADYLSHASRIIIDYNSLSDEHSKELLTYFPEASPANNVFSRSATHDVNQVSDKAVEGKGFMLGVKGQLPAAIKTPRDFGVNIAMGGAGQDNFNGKKISANGYSGHFYFHRNIEHKLLLAGLEQSAPPSVLSLLVGEKQYPEEEQQAHDQFGQGHSLTGASDTYTAAGSLYFSDPMYQAKLLHEKGVFPPAKYGAMQVTLTDENWSLVKEFLAKLRATAESANADELLKILLERPATAEEQEAVYSSYVALDFGNYLKHAYKVFIYSSELEEEKKASLLEMQVKLLSLIKKLQFGSLDALPEFKELMQRLTALDDAPKEYQVALKRISELFARQLNIDPKLENTQMSRPYQVGDLTYQALNSIHHRLNSSGEKDEHLKDYEFGDISWAILNRITHSTEGYQFGDISYAVLSQANQIVNGSNKEYAFGDLTHGVLSQVNQAVNGDGKEYQFGAITAGLLSKLSVTSNTEAEKVTPTNQPSGYRFGDFTRNLLWGTPSAVVENPKESKDDENISSLDDGWTEIGDGFVA